MNLQSNPDEARGSLASADSASAVTPGAAGSAVTVSFEAAPATQPTRPAIPHAGRYQLDRCLGRGGFGEVWKGHDPVLDLVVAIKMPRTDRAFTQEAIERFLDEARKQARLNHPAIVKIRHAERDGASWLIVSDFIDGGSLRECLNAKRFSHAESALLIADIADALHVAHRQRLIHRDVKPGNILVDSAGRPYLTDFGLALSEDEQQSEKDTISGTYAYMSPEQIRGEAHFLDGRSDIFSLGIILYELLTGERPFRGGTLEECREQVLSRQPKPPRAIVESIPKELERICLKCLAKPVQERYATAADLAVELRAAVQPKSRRWLWSALGAAAVCVAAALVMTRPWAETPAPPKDEPKQAPAVVVPRPKQREGVIALWERTPTKLVWPASSLLEVKEAEESIWAVCDGAGLFKLGEIHEPNYVMRVRVKITQDALFGVVLGLRDVVVNGQDLVRFEMIRLTPQSPGASPKYFLSDFSVLYSLQRGGIPTRESVAHANIGNLPQRLTLLEITVTNSQLTSVRWDGRDVPEIPPSKPFVGQEPRVWQGGVGFYVHQGTFQMHRPEIESSKT